MNVGYMIATVVLYLAVIGLATHWLACLECRLLGDPLKRDSDLYLKAAWDEVNTIAPNED